jgi:hypothetical protein
VDSGSSLDAFVGQASRDYNTEEQLEHFYCQKFRSFMARGVCEGLEARSGLLHKRVQVKPCPLCKSEGCTGVITDVLSDSSEVVVTFDKNRT